MATSDAPHQHFGFRRMLALLLPLLPQPGGSVLALLVLLGGASLFSLPWLKRNGGAQPPDWLQAFWGTFSAPLTFDFYLLTSRPALAAFMLAIAGTAFLLRKWCLVWSALLFPVAAVQIAERCLKVLYAPEGMSRGTFPSGHATAATAVAVAGIALAASQRLLAARLIALPLILGWWGVAILGVVSSDTHPWRDVLGGVATGLGVPVSIALLASLSAMAIRSLGPRP